MKIRRKLSMLLVLVMCFSLIPNTAFAGSVAVKPDLTKTAEWINAGDGTAKITLKTKGSPIDTNSGADVVVVMDYSGSMGYTAYKECGCTTTTEKDFWGVSKCTACGTQYGNGIIYPKWEGKCTHQLPIDTRWNLAKKALGVSLNEIIPNTKSNNKVAFVAFDSKVRNGYTVDATNDKNDVLNLVDGLKKPSPSNSYDPIQKGTNYEDALKKANEYIDSFKKSSNNKKPVYVVFLSDGEPDRGLEGESYKQVIKDKATVYTVGLSLDNNASNVLKRYATSTQYHNNVTDPSDLSGIFGDISKVITSKVTVTDVVNQEVFDVLSVGKPTSGTANLSSDKKTVTWTLDNFRPEGDTLEIIIKLNADNIAEYKEFVTNERASATYVSASGNLEDLAVSNTKPSNEKPVIERTKTQYAVKFYNEDGKTQLGETQNVYEGSTATKPENPTKPETTSATYTFAGWVPVDEHAGYTIDNIGNVTQAMSFKATFTAHEKVKFTISYNAGAGTGTMTPDTAYVGSELTVRTNEFTAPVNCIFDGWKDATGRNVATGSILTENTVLTAQWRTLEEVPGVRAEGYEGIYDGAGHGITVTAPTGAKVEYSLNGTDWTETNPKYINAMDSKAVQYRVSMKGYKTVEGSADVKIAKKPITVESGSLERVYDGKPLTASTAVVKGLAEVDEGKITATATGTITDAGSISNTAAVNGDADLLSNYTVFQQFGTLTVTARPITLTAKSATIDWTGEKLNVEAPGYDITGGTLAEGQTITNVTVSEGQTDPGEYTTTVSNAQIGTFTGNYDIKYAEGKLVIKQQDMSTQVKAEGYQGIYDGISHGITVTAPTGAKVEYSLNGTDWTETNPKYINAMDSKAVQYRVSMKGYKTVEGSADVKIAKKPITVESGSLERVYDGKPLTAPTAVVKGLAEVDEGKITATATGTITDAGSISNTAAVNGDADLLSNYTVFQQFGTLTVTARPITLTAKSVTLDWTGEKLNVEAPGYDITGGTLAEGQTITNVTVSEGQTDPGEYTTTVSNAQIGTFTGNYDIKYAEGKLVIKQLDMSSEVKAEGYEGVYDGTAHGIKVEIPSGAKVEYSVENSLTSVGELTVGYTVSKPGYANVTGSKNIKLTARPVTLTAKSATLDWTGEKLNVEAPGYDITGGTLAEGQTITNVTVSEGQTDPGEYTTTVSNAQIGTFTGNYDIKYAEGKLVIKQQDMSAQVKAEGYKGIYDGISHGITVTAPTGAKVEYSLNGTDWTETNPKYINAMDSKAVQYRVSMKGYKTVEGSADVKIAKKPITVESGSLERVYDGKPLTAPTAVVKGLAEVDEGKITATATGTITDAGSISNAAVVNDNSGLLSNYTVFQQFGTLTVTARPVTLTAKSATIDWTGEKLNVEAPGYDITGGTLAEGQTITNVTVSEGQTDPGEYTTTVSNAQIGTFTGNYDIKYAEGKLVIKQLDMSSEVKAEGYEGVYDGTAHGIKVEIPSGAKVEYSVENSLTSVGELTVGYTVSKPGYANVTGSKNIKLTARPITLTAKSAIIDWTGEKLNVEAPGYDITGGTLAEGQTITNVTVSEGQTDPGEYTTTVSNAQIGTFTGNYDIKYAEGKLVIKQLDMSSEVKAEGYEGVYDGTAHGIKVEIPSGAKVEYSVENSLTSVGELTVGYTVSKPGYANVTGSKNIKLTARPITLTAKSATIDWTGEKLNVEAPGYDITGGTLAEGQTITNVTVSEGQTDPGEYTTTVSNAQIGTFTGNYDIKYAEGKLVIKQLDMSSEVKAEGYEGVYDGTAHGIKAEVPSGAKVEYSVENSLTSVGELTVGYTVSKPGYANVTGSKNIKLTARPITLIAGSVSKIYDGTALTTTSYAISAGAIVTKQSISVTVTGSQIQVGSTASAITEVMIKDSEGNDVTSNYEITKLTGVLTVNSSGGSGGHHHNNNNNNNNNNTTTINDEAVPLAGTMELNKTDHFNYVKGYQDGNVKPLNNITREEVATIFYRLLTEPSRAMYFSKDENFSDIASSRWSLNAIATLANGKVITGYENGTFGATRPITRAEFAAIASRFDSLEVTNDNQFSDVSNHWAKSYINSAAKKGWINGYENGTFKPDQYITRAEAMTLINKVLERRVDAAGLMNGYKVFPDNKENTWYYYQVIEATNNHKYADRKNMNDMEKWTEILSDKTWNE
ncbi:MAG: S-layer homology domain-containing protein [Aminipila sp.]